MASEISARAADSIAPDKVRGLVARIRDLDEDALSELYDLFSSRVYALTYAVTREETLAQEAAQDAFMKVWTRAEQFSGQIDKFQSWLLTIARRCALDKLRAERSRSGQSDSMDALLYDLPDTEQITEARWQDLRLAMAGLPPEQVEVIELSFYRDMSHNDISAYLGVPLGTVKGRVRSGLGRLRSAWLGRPDE